jgi:DNA polymerase III delta prime subunit
VPIDRRIWTFKYEPTKISDMVLNEEIRPMLEEAIERVPNMLLYGTPGVGKGTFTNIFLKETGFDKMWINASDFTGIDAIRDKVRPFATSMSLSPLKIIVLNEADSLTSGPQGAQKMLRQLVEDVHKICRFILICNYVHFIIQEMESRFTYIKIDDPPKKEIGKLCLKILKSEKVKYSAKDVISIVEKCYPDIRKTINVLQQNTIKGKLTGSRISLSEALWERVLSLILKQDVEGVRTELRSNYIDYPDLFKFLYENAGEFKEPGGAILLIGEHLNRNTLYPIKEINFMHMMVEMIFQKVI